MYRFHYLVITQHYTDMRASNTVFKLYKDSFYKVFASDEA
ncbi:hypothetical protein N480_16350 [Pseudoalteromonas luteoviolacea S2607]|uniref:Uncharacterized protein n=2 Tax=Pseudoalteromonas luteoviolacea TaxID=43657 RepID=A0A167AMI5_9GAMM|nr:hypothetical protein N480_16350 [Pseudoalteromonas luteoviolacea S2607]KZN45579.1 hypothetical protein N482_14260 [Pseudoalteromonas luteoviolacea NCIMB 1942]KZN66975.1 hypothetical protein N478_19290 [Pseudoalteromonas luteoviolacea S4060-1]